MREVQFEFICRNRARNPPDFFNRTLPNNLLSVSCRHFVPSGVRAECRGAMEFAEPVQGPGSNFQPTRCRSILC